MIDWNEMVFLFIVEHNCQCASDISPSSHLAHDGCFQIIVCDAGAAMFGDFHACSETETRLDKICQGCYQVDRQVDWSVKQAHGCGNCVFE